MRRPLALIAMKFAVIFYFAACTNVTDYTQAKSVTPVVTRGNWKVNLYMDANNDKTNDFAGYSFSFANNGTVKAVKGALEISGNWYEDNIANKVVIDMGTADPVLQTINDLWDVVEVSNLSVTLEHKSSNTERLTINSR